MSNASDDAVFAASLWLKVQNDLGQRFPGRSLNLFALYPLVWPCVADLFRTLSDEDGLADSLNASFEQDSVPWRIVRAS